MDPLTTAAVNWSFSAAGWLISPILTRFLNRCFDALGIDPPPKFQSRKQILHAKLEKLQTTLLPQLLVLADVAQQSPHRHFLEKWLQKLKFTFYEAEHVLGLIEYERLENQVNSLFPSSSYKLKLKNLKSKSSSEKKNLILSIEKLEKVVNEAMEFVPILNLPSSSGGVAVSNWKPDYQYRETISTPGSTIVGRDKDRDGILKLLREDFPESSSNARCYSVIGIWGMGGSGKTALAQYVCDHEKEIKYFDHIIWVHVQENFNVRTLMRSMLESVFGSNCPNYENLDVLSSELASKLRGKRYLLVLDDVWCNKGLSETKLNQFFAPLRDGKRGSKILVTTRNEEAARAMGAADLIRLRELNDQEFFSLFMTYALRDVKVNKHLEERLQEIGLMIVEKLCRLPLAAITVAGQLRRRIDPDFWLSIVNKRIINDIMGTLYLSYQHLHPELQRCFAFCSFLSKGQYFDQNYLVNLWIAEGFTETDGSNEHMKEIANQYFQELISSSLFQVDKNYNYLYFMHDLIHDLAQHVSQGECFKIRSGEGMEIPIQTRHLRVRADMLEEYVEKICKLKYLCTICVDSSSSAGTSLKEVHVDALFTNLRKLYVMDLPHIRILPKSLIHLKNLRYLKFAISQSDAIHELLINRLYQLRTLNIWSSRHLFRNKIMFPDAGRLILLQDLEEFHVRTSRGFELKQLEHLNDLSGMLTIRDLHNVRRKEEAYQAKLDEKRGLESLCYSWSDDSGDVLRDIDVEILDGLRPPTRIKKISIEGYSGKKLCSWIWENDKVPYLNHLELLNCQGLETLQNIKGLSSLLSLTICNLPRLKSWGPLPSRLTQFKLTNCVSLVLGLKKDLEMIASISSMRISEIVTFLESCRGNYYSHVSKEQYICVQNMMKLGNHNIDEQALSIISKDLKKCLAKRFDLIFQLTNVYGDLYLPPMLEKLTIGSCFITDKVLAASLQGLNSLTHMELWDIMTITCIPEEVLSSLNSLMVLEIKGCLLLTSIGGWDTHNTLTQLKIEWCPNLTIKTSVAANSSDVELTLSPSCRSKTTSGILNYVSLQRCLPSNDMFQRVVSLETLSIWDCPTIVSPHIGYMKSLVHLDFHDCPNLVSLRGLHELNNLKKLELIRCEKFECYSDADKLPRMKELSTAIFFTLNNLLQEMVCHLWLLLHFRMHRKNTFLDKNSGCFGTSLPLQKFPSLIVKCTHCPVCRALVLSDLCASGNVPI